MKIKIDNLTFANDAISKAGVLINNSKTFAGRNDADDNRIALQKLVDAAEHETGHFET